MLGLAGGLLLGSRRAAPRQGLRTWRHDAPRLGHGEAVRAARGLNRAAGMLAVSVLADSAIEHYRGDFRNPAMFIPLASASLSLLASGHGMADRRSVAHRARDTAYALAGGAGIAGTGFHFYNLGKRTGGLCWQNLFYGAPIGAPMAMALSGLMGFLAERVRGAAPGTVPRLLGRPAGRVVAAATGAGLLGTVGEAGLLHFRGAFQNPAMLLPVTMPPVAAALIGHAALGAPRRRPFTRLWLCLTATLGVVGVGFHAWGVQRMMGGWRNWQQNLVDGPPLPAPPSFTGLALAGLAALRLLEGRDRG
ncbi:hypothetical protein M0638_22195 [Roseomonas sp. NAR14]|uniref:Uncharacterized protein n=1 Tax=Roseomonas acroporae TaxID=2937791 RepID=A0A9X1YCA6_9PROT|nr:hypothetical protein [Roseomonas acroporae]